MDGLYYMDLAIPKKKASKNSISDDKNNNQLTCYSNFLASLPLDLSNGAPIREKQVALVSTIKENLQQHSKCDKLRAAQARKMQVIIGRPKIKDFMSYLDKNLIPISPITSDDAQTAYNIYGQEVSSLKGKITRRKGEHVPSRIINIPFQIMEKYQKITLCINNMFVNSLNFFMSASRHIVFIASEYIHKQDEQTLFITLAAIYAIYRKRGYTITQINDDGEFECLQGDIASNLKDDLNIAPNDEHVPEIERTIRTIKERFRCLYHSTPFKHYPPCMIVEMVFLTNFWLNAFPKKNGVSTLIIPRTLITGKHIDYNKHCKYKFGQYVQTHKEHDNWSHCTPPSR